MAITPAIPGGGCPLLVIVQGRGKGGLTTVPANGHQLGTQRCFLPGSSQGPAYCCTPTRTMLPRPVAKKVRAGTPDLSLLLDNLGVLMHLL